MAVDMFLELDGIKGESVDSKHKDKIDVLAWSWGLSQTGTFAHGSGGGAGKANFNDLTITKYIDKSSADLMYHCASGKHITKGQVIVRKAGDKPLEYLVIKVDNILVSSVSTGGSSGDERLTESVTLNFAKVAVEYKIQDEKGAGKDGGQFTWNIATNTK
jgi:type VI secretion system secreted protein Hcp